MPIHQKDDVRTQLLDDIYAASDLSAPLPKYRLPGDEQQSRHIHQVLHDELMLDGNSRQNLAASSTTWMERAIQQLMAESVEKNMIDKDEHPQTAEIEARSVHMLADRQNSPKSAITIGCSTPGSSEAAMLGGLALKWKWRERRRAEGKSTNRPNLVTGPVQVCWHKFCRHWDIELCEFLMDGDRLITTPEEAVKRCDEYTIGVVPTLGVTFTSQYEPVKALSDALDHLEREQGINIPIHVDASSGGFLAPFVEPDLEWGFRPPRVKSIDASGHKFGLAPLGVGWIVWRHSEDLDEDLIFRVNNLGGDMPTFALNFSRPGGEVACQYYNFLRLGLEGYRKIQQACYDNTKCLAEAISKMEPFEIIHAGEGGLPAVCWKLKENAEVSFNIYDFADQLRSRGWLVPVYSMPSNRTDLVIQCILVRHGFSRDLGTLRLDDIQRTLEHLEIYAASKPMTEVEAGGDNHSGRSITKR